MKADYITYRQAATASVWGVLVQAVLSAALLIYGLIGKDHAAVTGAIFAGIGIIAWIGLAVVFDQHRRERLEAIEADALSSTLLAGTSVFSAGVDDFRPAAKRLAGLHKFFTPAIAVMVAVLLLIASSVRFVSGRTGVETMDFVPPVNEGWGLAIGLSVAAIGFIFARYQAGMAKVTAWSNLRAGASFAVGTALIGLYIGVANLTDLVGPDLLLRWGRVVIPVMLGIIGIEIVLHVLLGLYRPRRAGEIPQAAFDSRLLSLLAAPDRIAQSISDAVNYQLGFDVTSGWFYKLLSRSLVPLILFGVLVIWALSAVAVVRPHQRALMLRFGSVVKKDLEPGMHLKWPWPIESVYIPEYYIRESNGKLAVKDYTVTGVRTIELATPPPATLDPILWTNDHAGEEVYQLVRTGTGSKAGDLLDFAIVSAEIPLQYIVSDVLLYDSFAPPQQRDELLKAVARRELVRFFQNATLDDLLGANRLELSRQARQRIQSAFDKLGNGGAGVQVVYLAIAGVHPPKDTAGAFETPVQADQRLQANVEAARAAEVTELTRVAGDVTLAREIVSELKALDDLRDRKGAGAKDVSDANIRDQEFKVQKLLERAGGSASAVLLTAQAERWNRHMSVRGIAARHQGRTAMYEASPQLFKAREYFTTMRDVLKDARLYITPKSGLVVDFDVKDKDFGQDVFTPGKPGG